VPPQQRRRQPFSSGRAHTNHVYQPLIRIVMECHTNVVLVKERGLPLSFFQTRLVNCGVGWVRRSTHYSRSYWDHNPTPRTTNRTATLLQKHGNAYTKMVGPRVGGDRRELMSAMKSCKRSLSIPLGWLPRRNISCKSGIRLWLSTIDRRDGPSCVSDVFSSSLVPCYQAPGASA
jgi:hypothetical protein